MVVGHPPPAASVRLVRAAPLEPAQGQQAAWESLRSGALHRHLEELRRPSLDGVVQRNKRAVLPAGLVVPRAAAGAEGLEVDLSHPDVVGRTVVAAAGEGGDEAGAAPLPGPEGGLRVTESRTPVLYFSISICMQQDFSSLQCRHYIVDVRAVFHSQLDPHEVEERLGRRHLDGVLILHRH